jgi:Fe-S-cluster containining protein
MDCEKKCKICPPKTHCCVFKENAGFTFVTLSNAKEIHKRTKQEYSQFLDYTPLSPEIISLLKEGDPALEGYLRYSQLDNKGRLLRLKKKGNNCIFLDDNKMCKIYDIRPNICRMYPLWAMRLTDDSIKVIAHDPESARPTIESGIDDIEKSLTKKEIDEIKELFKEIEQEAIEYKASQEEIDVILAVEFIKKDS